MPKYIDKTIKVTNKNSSHYGKTGLVYHETTSMLHVVSFVKTTKEDCRFKREIKVKERPFRDFKINKKSVKIVPESNFTKREVKLARSQAGHMSFSYSTTKPHFKWKNITETIDCSKHWDKD
jgi:hypothetical protein